METRAREIARSTKRGSGPVFPKVSPRRDSGGPALCARRFQKGDFTGEGSGRVILVGAHTRADILSAMTDRKRAGWLRDASRERKQRAYVPHRRTGVSRRWLTRNVHPCARGHGDVWVQTKRTKLAARVVSRLIITEGARANFRPIKPTRSEPLPTPNVIPPGSGDTIPLDIWKFGFSPVCNSRRVARERSSSRQSLVSTGI